MVPEKADMLTMSAFFPHGVTAMARKNIRARRHARKFAKGARRTRRINQPSHIMRGGFRL